MSLANQFNSKFGFGVRRRGRAYSEQGAVTNFQGTRNQVTARVRGSRLYDVALAYDLEKDLLIASCSCPFGAGCKHVYAVLLATDEYKVLDAVGSDSALMFESEEDWRDDDLDNEPQDDVIYMDTGGGNRMALTVHRPKPPAKKDWRQRLTTLADKMRSEATAAADQWPADRQMLYIIDARATTEGRGLTVRLMTRDRKASGEWARPSSRSISLASVRHLPDADRQLLSLLVGPGPAEFVTHEYGYSPPLLQTITLAPAMDRPLVELMCRTGRCMLATDAGIQPDPLVWDDRSPWEFRIEIRREGASRRFLISGGFWRDGKKREFEDSDLLTGSGLLFTDGKVGPLELGGALDWLTQFRSEGEFSVPLADAEAFVESLTQLPHVPALELPPELQFERSIGAPRPRLHIRRPRNLSDGINGKLAGELSFDYGGVILSASDPRQCVFQREPRALLDRDRNAEAGALQFLRTLGFRDSARHSREPGLYLAERYLQKTVAALTAAGWWVEAEGKIFRTGGSIEMQVRSGIDWFELHGEISFDGHIASMPQLLRAMRKGESSILLDDGTYGMVPEEWLKRYGTLAAVGEAGDDHVRFRPTQTALLDALLATQDTAVTVDETFERARERLRQFDGVAPAEPPPSFVGELRPYQKVGLGWMRFLREFGFGGCLADDMGLGKTVQVLAMLDERPRRTETTEKRPSLVVAPRSLIYNWVQEAARFTPNLRVLDHSQADRAQTTEPFADYDLIVTTYGTLRRDAALFADYRFDYAILDESQAIKNHNTASAKAARLLKADHRLALSGTPVENRLSELWSLMEFLNPGMLGAVSVFGGYGTSAPGGSDGRAVLARALRPFILRRTKQQVASDLPEKTEQTIYCELSPPQRKLYNELRDHYRTSLLDRVARQGIARSKIHVLEALLRLRQAACHPALIDKKYSGGESAKLDALLEQLDEVASEQHKALVFSQFTSLLAIVRKQLDERGVVYEYLDGKTKDRQARVERFQTDPDCKLFLISLKAGGLGLNLTAAEYVFLLDPWWNPAVEAQAIDRAHRIGQTQRVFAYRLIARDTVEEKVVELQNTKRDLADAIINADNSLIRSLHREDLELLLS